MSKTIVKHVTREELEVTPRVQLALFYFKKYLKSIQKVEEVEKALAQYLNDTSAEELEVYMKVSQQMEEEMEA